MMKKKILSLLALAFVFSLPASSQVWFGPKIVPQQTTIKGHKFIMNDEVYASGDALTESYGDLTFNYGVFVRRHFSKVYVQAEALLANYSSRIDLRNGESSYIGNEQVSVAMLTSTMKRLEVPTIVGFKMGAFWVQGGFISAVPLQASLKYNFERLVMSEDGMEGQYTRVEGEVKEKNYYNDFQFDGQLGLGVTIMKRVLLDFRYQTNLTNRRESIEVLDQSANPGEKMSSIGLGLAINLGKR